MTEVYYKATRPDGTDFRTGTIAYRVGETINHPKPHARDASGYLSVATVPTDCTGMSWPCRLFEVTASDVWLDHDHPNKRCTHSLTVVREVDAHMALGPQGVYLAELIGQAERVTETQARVLYRIRKAAREAARDAAWAAAKFAARPTARDASWDAAWGAAVTTAREAVRDAAWDAAVTTAREAVRDAAWDAAGGLCVRDLIGSYGFTQERYDLLTGPWRKVIGPIHPDDEPMK